MNKPNKIIIHHSATADNKAHKDFDSIKQGHLNLGYRDIGYHYVIESVNNQYKIIPGRAETDTGAHAIGQNNNSIGICLVGNFMEESPPEGQMQTLIYLIKDIYNRYGELPIYGHRDFNATACPGDKFPMDRLKKMLGEDPVDEIKEYTDINDIVWDLNNRGIISESDIWTEKADEDQDVYWLLRKSLHYMRLRD